MEYNDYQIFDDSTFKLMQESYKSKPSIDRKTIINKLCFELVSCKSFCFAIPNSFNKKITSEIDNLKNNLTSMLDNLNANFNTNINSRNSYPSFNLFKLLRKTISIIELLNNWNKNEEKEYYKILINNFLNNLFLSLSNLFSACEQSEIKFFKFM